MNSTPAICVLLAGLSALPSCGQIRTGQPVESTVGRISPDGAGSRDAQEFPSSLPRLRSRPWLWHPIPPGFTEEAIGLQFRNAAPPQPSSTSVRLSDSEATRLAKVWFESHVGIAKGPISFSYAASALTQSRMTVAVHEVYRGVRIDELLSSVVFDGDTVIYGLIRVRQLDVIPGSDHSVVPLEVVLREWSSDRNLVAPGKSVSADSRPAKQPFLVFARSARDLARERADDDIEVRYYSPQWIRAPGSPLRIDAHCGNHWRDD